MGLFGTYTSESGKFRHIGGIVNCFEPSPENVIEVGIDAPDGWTHETRHYDKAIKSLKVPEGVKGFVDSFFQDFAVTESVYLPESLLSIGSEGGTGCVFAGCYLPEIVLPASLLTIGKYAFGHSYIRKLIVDPANKSKYNRQFKDSTIEELFLPKSGIEKSKEWNSDAEYGFYRNFFIHCKCTIFEY